MTRFKHVIGDGLRSHTDERQATKVEAAVLVLNCMFELGCPNSVRIVRTPIGAGVNASISPTHATATPLCLVIPSTSVAADVLAGRGPTT